MCMWGECVSSRLEGRSWQRWIDSVNDCLKRRGLNVGQARRMMYDGKMADFVRGNV